MGLVYLVEFTLGTTRKSGIKSGYRPDWINLRQDKPDYHCGCLILPKNYDCLQLGEKAQCLLYPLI